MNAQTHPGLTAVGIQMPRTARSSTAQSSRSRVGRRTATLLAAVAIELFVAIAVVAMATGVGSAPRAVSTRPGAAPFVTPAPEAAPTPRPGF